jgi:hypothetical protein
MTESYIAVIAWLAGSCFCGLIPLGIAAILFFTARKRSQVGTAVSRANKLPIGSLQPRQDLIRLQGRIDPAGCGFDGPPETAVVFLRLKVERYQSDQDSSGWRGLTDKVRSVPFRLDDGSASVWINPEGLDKQLLGEPSIPTDEQVQADCILLGISPNMLRGRLRFSMWEQRGGQSITVIGVPTVGLNGLEIKKVPEKPFVVSPLLGEAVEGSLVFQKNKARTWMLVLGIPGAVFLLCGFVGAIVSLVRIISSS